VGFREASWSFEQAVIEGSSRAAVVFAQSWDDSLVKPRASPGLRDVMWFP
jgi:hypothetical protein